MDKYTLIANICMCNRRCMPCCCRCNINDQVLSALFKLYRMPQPGKRGIGFSLFGLSELTVLLMGITSLCVMQKISLFTSIGYNVTVH